MRAFVSWSMSAMPSILSIIRECGIESKAFLKSMKAQYNELGKEV
jgi:hypothetical protein